MRGQQNSEKAVEKISEWLIAPNLIPYHNLGYWPNVMSEVARDTGRTPVTRPIRRLLASEGQGDNPKLLALGS
jgi:hypothetical protein